MDRWHQYNGDLNGDAEHPHSSARLDIDALLQLASQSVFARGAPIGGVANHIDTHAVSDPDPPQVLFSRDTQPFFGPPSHSVAGDLLRTRQHSTDQGQASPSVQSNPLGSPLGSGDWAAQRGQTTRAHSRLVSPFEPQEQEDSSSDEREAPRGSSKQPDDAAALKALREKNRRAQRKFRERQKQKLAESEGRTQELQAALEKLRVEKSALETRNALLEKIVGMRSGGQQQLPQPPAPVQIEEVEGLGSAQETVEEVIGTGRLDGANAALIETQPPALQTIHLTVRKGRPGLRSADGMASLSPEQIRSLPQHELAALWKDYVTALTGLLQEARGDASCPAGQRIGQLVTEVRLVLSGLMSANPKRWSSLRALKMDPKGQAPTMEAPPSNWSHNMFRAMKLTDRQRRAAVAHRNQLLLRMGDTLRARRDISLQLLRTLGDACANRAAMDLLAGNGMAQGLHVASDAAEALRRNIVEEQRLYNQFLHAVRTIVQPIQAAIAIVQAYPWCPDALAVFNCAAEEVGAPPAHELLACPLPGGPAWPPHTLLAPQMPQLETAGA